MAFTLTLFRLLMHQFYINRHKTMDAEKIAKVTYNGSKCTNCPTWDELDCATRESLIENVIKINTVLKANGYQIVKIGE